MTDLDSAVLYDIGWPQGVVNWDVVQAKYAAGLFHGVIIRVSGGLTKDAQAANNIANAVRRMIPWGVYHAFSCYADARAQARFFANEIGYFTTTGFYTPNYTLFPALDVEVRPSWVSVASMKSRVDSFFSEWDAYTLLKPIHVYTRASWWDVNMPRTDYATRRKLWVAHYNSAITAPAIPIDWRASTWTIWQWSADGNGKRPDFDGKAGSIDTNRYNGGLAKLHADYPAAYGTPGGGGGDDGMVAVRLYTAQGNMRVRPAPNTSNTEYFIIPAGTPVHALEDDILDAYGNLWVRTGLRQYVAKRYNGITYLA